MPRNQLHTLASGSTYPVTNTNVLLGLKAYVAGRVVIPAGGCSASIANIMSQTTADNAKQSLKGGALGLGDVFMQAITHTAPATAILFTIPFITAKAGVTAPLAYLFAFLLVLVLGITLAQLAKHLPSAGGYYTYISHTISPRAGFLTSWVYLLYDPLAAGYALAYTGYIVQQSLQLNYNIHFPWWLFLLLSTAFVCFST
ncbi:MAG TPA: hypothetical protein VHB48_17490, partial [Chitinophagaceae bacterium]|nr:hypothetical protein [Chitinophagaceae bacterium]